MVTYFNRKDMISFGTYLTSERRKSRVIESYKEDVRNGIKNPLSIEDRVKLVTHADIENWISDNKGVD